MYSSLQVWNWRWFSRGNLANLTPAVHGNDKFYFLCFAKGLKTTSKHPLVSRGRQKHKEREWKRLTDRHKEHKRQTETENISLIRCVCDRTANTPCPRVLTASCTKALYRQKNSETAEEKRNKEVAERKTEKEIERCFYTIGYGLHATTLRPLWEATQPLSVCRGVFAHILLHVSAMASFTFFISVAAHIM